MNTSDLIYLFIDGEANDLERQILFDKLASNNELQLEFQDALKINKNLATNDSKLVPSALLTDTIFSQAGLTQILGTTAVIGSGAAITSNFFQQGLALLNTKFAVGIASALASLILSVGITSLFFNLENNSGSSSYANSSKNKNTTIIPSNQTSNSTLNSITNTPLNKITNIPVTYAQSDSLKYAGDKLEKLNKENSRNLTYISKLNNENQSLKEKINYLQNYSNDLSLINYQNKTEEIEELQNIDKIEDKEKLNILLEEDNFLNLSRFNKNQINQNEDNINSIRNEMNLRNKEIYFQTLNSNNNDIYKSLNRYLLSEDKEVKLLLDYRGISGLEYFPKRITEEKNDSRYNNFSISGVIKVSDGLFIGLSGGQEEFPVYLVSQGNFRYQNSLLWLALTGRYYVSSLNFSTFSPFIETSFGGTQIGPLNKTLLGISWEPIKNINFNVAAESTNILFSNQNNVRSAGKLGLIYGITFKF